MFSQASYKIPTVQNVKLAFPICNFNANRTNAVFSVIATNAAGQIGYPSQWQNTTFQALLSKEAHGEMVQQQLFFVVEYPVVAGTATVTIATASSGLSVTANADWPPGISSSITLTGVTFFMVSVFETIAAPLLPAVDANAGYVDQITGEIRTANNGKPKKNALLYSSVAALLDRIAHRDSLRLSTRSCPDDKPIVARRQLEIDPYAAAQAQISPPIVLDSESMVELYSSVPGG